MSHIVNDLLYEELYNFLFFSTGTSKVSDEKFQHLKVNKLIYLLTIKFID